MNRQPEDPPGPVKVEYPEAQEVLDGREVIHPETGPSVTRQLYVNIAMALDDPRWPEIESEMKIVQSLLTRGSAEYLAAKQALAAAQAERRSSSQRRSLPGSVLRAQGGGGVKEEFDTVTEAAKILGILPSNLYARIKHEREKQTKALGFEPEFLDFKYRNDSVRIRLGGDL